MEQWCLGSCGPRNITFLIFANNYPATKLVVTAKHKYKTKTRDNRHGKTGWSHSVNKKSCKKNTPQAYFVNILPLFACLLWFCWFVLGKEGAMCVCVGVHVFPIWLLKNIIVLIYCVSIMWKVFVLVCLGGRHYFVCFSGAMWTRRWTLWVCQYSNGQCRWS